MTACPAGVAVLPDKLESMMRMQPSKDEMHVMKHSPDPEVQKLKDQLNPMGRFRAANLWQVFGTGKSPPGAYSTPDVIYAMKAGDVRASNLRLCSCLCFRQPAPGFSGQVYESAESLGSDSASCSYPACSRCQTASAAAR